jgi:hypothetical protein
MGNITIKERNKCHHYHKDQWNVYFCDKKVPQATAISFIDLGHGYGKDAFDVFYMGNIINGANSMTFSVDKNGYAYDSFTSYYKGIPAI